MNDNKSNKKEVRISSVGGQAVMEGVMMRGPEGIALAVRQPDKTVITEFTPYASAAKKGTFLGLPLVRGVVSFVESLKLGMSTLTRSAELAGEDMEDEKPSKFEEWLAKTLGKSVDKVVIGIAVIIAIALSVGLFFVLPTLISSLIFSASGANTVFKSLTEGLVRLAIFIGYILATSFLKDIRRVFMYHGAEHKTIACYEAGEELTPENAMKFTRLHPRCGTNYLFLVMAVSILFFAAIGWNESFWLRLASRLIFLPLVAGISYEVLKLAAKSNSLAARIARAPGLALQRLTTREPTPDMIEVAIAAFNLAMSPADGNSAHENTEKTDADMPAKEVNENNESINPAGLADGAPAEGDSAHEDTDSKEAAEPTSQASAQAPRA